MNALTHAAQHNENLLAAAVNAARVRATLGEISDALEVAFDRYLVPSQCVTGVIAQSYHQSEKSASEFDAIVAQTEQFLADNGRRPRILIDPRAMIALMRQLPSMDSIQLTVLRKGARYDISIALR